MSGIVFTHLIFFFYDIPIIHRGALTHLAIYYVTEWSQFGTAVTTRDLVILAVIHGTWDNNEP